MRNEWRKKKNLLDFKQKDVSLKPTATSAPSVEHYLSSQK